MVASLASRQDPSLPRRPRSRSPVRRPFAKGELARATHSDPVRQLDVYRPSSSSGRQRKSPVPLQLLSHHHIAQLDSQRSQSPKPVIDWRHVRPSWSQYCSDQRESSASRSPTVTGDPKRSFSQYSTVQRDSRGSRSPLATAEARSANRRRTDPLNRSPPTPAASPRPQERQGVTVSEAIIFDVADSGSSNASTADVEEDSSLEIERASGSSDGPSRSPSPEPINLPAARDERDEHCARRIVRQSRVHSRLPTPPAATPETNSDPDLPSPISPKPQVTGEHSSGPLKGDIVIETSPSLCFDFPSPSAIKLKLASWISAGSSPSRIADNIESREAISQEISGHNSPNLAAASSDPLEDDLIDFDREADGVVGFLDALAGPCDETAHDLQEEPLPSETSSSTLRAYQYESIGFTDAEVVDNSPTASLSFTGALDSGKPTCDGRQRKTNQG